LLAELACGDDGAHGHVGCAKGGHISPGKGMGISDVGVVRNGGKREIWGLAGGDWRMRSKK
jgi:hypothetical protein